MKTKSLVLELDSFGRVIKETTPNGEVTLRSYNADGLASSITDNLGNVTSYEYDSKNRISKISNATGFVIYEYDENNRVIKETDPMGYSVTHEYKDPETVGFVTVTTTDRNDRTNMTRGRFLCLKQHNK